LDLEQNPHFYDMLPTSLEAYRGDFQREPIENFWRWKTATVLVDNPGHAGRVFLETGWRRRVFGNAWVLNGIIIFKGSCPFCCFFFSLSNILLDICGKLEGESIVGEAIHDIPNLWCFEEFPMCLRNSPPLVVSATQISSAAGILLRDWREPIHRMLQSRRLNIRITYEPPI
jgi:hypothetical protein